MSAKISAKKINLYSIQMPDIIIRDLDNDISAITNYYVPT